MTALPEREAATSLLLNALLVKMRRTAADTAAESMIAPSTMLSGGTGSTRNRDDADSPCRRASVRWP